MNFLHSVIFTVKIGSGFYFLSATSLTLIQIYPEVIVSILKVFDMLPSLYPSYLYHHILPFSRLQKVFESALRTLWHPGYVEIFFLICAPLLTCPSEVFNLLGVGRGPQFYKKWTSNGGDNWG